MQLKKTRVILWLILVFVYSCGPSDNCLHRWPLDDHPGSKTVLDSVGQAHASVNGVRVGLSGKRATAASFNGQQGYILADISESRLVQYTVAVWVKASILGQSGYAAVLNNLNNEARDTPESFRGSFQIDVDGTNPGNYRIFFISNYVIFGPVTTEWQHLAVTYDGEIAKTYVDGVLMNSLSMSPDSAGTGFRHIVLGRNRRGDQYFSGLIDEVEIHSRALTPNEIAGLAAGNADGSCGRPSAK